MRIGLALAAFVLAAGAASAADGHGAAQMTRGNGDNNWIVTDGVARNGATFTFKEVKIDGNGWLVIHQIVDGKPVGEKYLGASYIASGVSKSVALTVDYQPKAGEPFVVMLHRDVNENKVFDFVFVDPPHVLDRAVFEGNKMIALVFQAP